MDEVLLLGIEGLGKGCEQVDKMGRSIGIISMMLLQIEMMSKTYLRRYQMFWKKMTINHSVKEALNIIQY